MTNYSIVLTRSARKELEQLPTSLQGRILAKIRALSHQPEFLALLNYREKQDFGKSELEINRVIYEILENEKIIEIAVIRHRKDVYRF